MIWENGQWLDASLMNYPQEEHGGWIYEIIRIENDCPVFIKDHLARLWQGAEKTLTPLSYTQHELFKIIFELIDKESSTNCNLRIQIDHKTGLIRMGFIPNNHSFTNDYSQGIDVGLLESERSNPNIKYWNSELRTKSDKIISDTGNQELILVNQDGYLTEGSRSNIFGIKKEMLITPPLIQVLPGITRQKIIELASEHSIPLSENLIHQREITEFDALFITGTTPGILPVSKINSHQVDPKHNLIKTLSDLYLEAVQQNIIQTVKNFRKTK